MQIKVNRTPHWIDGYLVEEFSLLNDQGFELRCTNFGATITHLFWPESNGGKEDILLGHNKLEDWFQDTNWFGSTAGRCCNRIDKARFMLDNIEYTLTSNTPPHQLHGGIKGFNRRVWRAYPEQSDTQVGVRMYLLSEDGDQGYPGNLAAEAFFALTDDNELIIEFKATTDMPTLCNITLHPYFNLEGTRDILDHEVMIVADELLLIDADCIPTGESMRVENTAFDFRHSVPIGKKLMESHNQLLLAKGIDHHYIFRENDFTSAKIIVNNNKMGRKLTFYTNQPGVQFYSGNHLNLTGKNGNYYKKHAGLCLETQGYPNAINTSHFPSIVLRKDENYHSYTKIKMEG